MDGHARKNTEQSIWSQEHMMHGNSAGSDRVNIVVTPNALSPCLDGGTDLHCVPAHPVRVLFSGQMVAAAQTRSRTATFALAASFPTRRRWQPVPPP